MDKKIIVASNANPDLDGYACAVGYAELLNKIGQPSEPLLTGSIDDETKFVLDIIGLQPLQKNTKSIEENKIILVDTSNFDSLKVSADPKNIIEIIDHRRVNDASLYPWAKSQIELVGSCATMIVEKFQQAQVEPSFTASYLLYGAIVSNTINFKNKITVERDIKAAAYLKNNLDIAPDFAEKMFRARTNITGVKLSDYLHKDFIEQTVCNKHLTAFQMEIVETDALIEKRLDEIKTIILDIIKDKKLDYCFLNIIDTLAAHNYILVFDHETEELLSKILNLSFNHQLVKTDYIIMRKEIMAKIKDHLGNQ